MKLFEICNGYTGESYVRVYVWAATLDEAITMAIHSFQKERPDDPNYCRVVRYFELFDASADPFVTEPDDAGWSRDR